MRSRWLRLTSLTLVAAVGLLAAGGCRAPDQRVDDAGTPSAEETVVEDGATSGDLGSTAQVVATWTDVDPGDGRMPTVAVNEDIYPTDQGVQFLVNGVVDDRDESARPDGWDATGPQHDSRFHVYPAISLSPGDEIDARWTDRDGGTHRVVHVVERGTSAESVGVPASDPLLDPVSAPLDVWPDAGSTGLRDPGLLKPSGSVSVSTNGTVVENLDIKGSITINADNVTVRNVRVTNDGAKYLISIASGRSGIVIEDVELDGRRVATHGIVHAGYTARRVNMYGVGDGFRAGSNTVIEDSWVHDLGHDGAYDPSPHLDAVQSVGGSNITIRNNRLEGPWQAQTSAIIFKAHFAPIENAVIEGNLLSGGTYTMYLRSTSNYAAGDVSVRDNVFVRNSWKFGHISGNAGIFSGNTFDDGTPI